jgi:hypothetical protein
MASAPSGGLISAAACRACHGAGTSRLLAAQSRGRSNHTRRCVSLLKGEVRFGTPGVQGEGGNLRHGFTWDNLEGVDSLHLWTGRYSLKTGNAPSPEHHRPLCREKAPSSPLRDTVGLPCSDTQPKSTLWLRIHEMLRRILRPTHPRVRHDHGSFIVVRMRDGICPNPTSMS